MVKYSTVNCAERHVSHIRLIAIGYVPNYKCDEQLLSAKLKCLFEMRKFSPVERLITTILIPKNKGEYS